MKKIFFLSLLVAVGLPSWAQTRASNVTMVTTFPVKYVSYDELYVHQMKLGLDRNTPAMLKIKQEGREQDLPGDRDFEALGKVTAEGIPALRVSTTTLNTEVAFGNIDQLIITQNPLSLSSSNPGEATSNALARFGRATISVYPATSLGLGMRALKIENEAPPILQALASDPCVDEVAQWIKADSSEDSPVYLGCDSNGGLTNRKQWARVPSVRQEGISNNKDIKIYKGTSITEDSNVWKWTWDDATPPNDVRCNGDFTPPTAGGSCATEERDSCIARRDCTPEDGCLYANEDGQAITSLRVYERWSCVAL